MFRGRSQGIQGQLQSTDYCSSCVRKRKLDLWISFVATEVMSMIDGLHLIVKGAAVFADGLKRAVDGGYAAYPYAI